MKILVLDDEPKARKSLITHLNRTDLVIDELQEADSFANAESLLKNFTPDLAFLDINLPDGLSFDLLERIGLGNISFKIVFISAYDAYAIKAFRFNAIDYLLKPINPLEFEETISRAYEKDSEEQLKSLSSDFKNEAKSLNRLVLKDHQSIQVVNIDEIILCKSENNYTLFYLTSGEQILIAKTLKEYDDMLQQKLFFRPHKSYLINLKHLSKYEKKDGGTILMTGDHRIPLSRFKKDIFMKVLEQL